MFNEASNDVDIRFEGATKTSLLALDGGNEQVSVGGFFNLATQGELTVATGAITVTGSLHTVDTQDDDATDDLNTINGGNAGDILVLYSADNGRDTTLKDGADNLLLAGDFALSAIQDKIVLIKVGADMTGDLFNITIEDARDGDVGEFDVRREIETGDFGDCFAQGATGGFF